MSTSEPTTRIYRLRAAPIDAPSGTPDMEDEVGYVDAAGVIFRLRWGEGKPIGRVDETGHIYRNTTFGERELGATRPNGAVQSAGLFAGGDAGWVTSDGIVTQGGLILGEEEVGRVEGPRPVEAGAALLLIFLPDEWEAEHAARD